MNNNFGWLFIPKGSLVLSSKCTCCCVIVLDGREVTVMVLVKPLLKHCKSYATHTIHKRTQCHLCCQDSKLSYLIYLVHFWFHRPLGSDCGLVNVNIPTSGAEIGGAFGKSIINNHSLKMRWILAECLPSGEAAREIICRYSPRLKRIIWLF